MNGQDIKPIIINNANIKITHKQYDCDNNWLDNNRIHKLTGTLDTESCGAIKDFQNIKRLYGILQRTKRFRIKKKLYKRINKTIAGKFYLQCLI